MIGDQLAAYIRTYVPMAVGWVLAYLTLNYGFEVSAETELALASGLGGVLAAAYYFAANLLSKRWPAAQWLLGYNQTPSYGDGGGPTGVADLP